MPEDDESADSEDSMRSKVRSGYEEIGLAERQSGEEGLMDEEREFYEKFLARVPGGAEGARVVDMGCGTGVPYTRWLSERGCAVTGVDFVQDHIDAAEDNVPAGEFVQSSFLDFDADRKFAGMVCMFALFHVPREEQESVLEHFHGLLVEGAPLLITMGTEDVEELEHEFFGAEMQWSFYGAERNRALLEDAGFEIVDTALIQEQYEDESEHLWVLAERV